MTQRVSIEEFRKNMKVWMDKLYSSEEIIITKRGKDAYILANCTVQEEVKESKGDEDLGEIGYRVRFGEYQRKTNRWRDKVGPIDGKTFKPFVEAEW